MKGVGESQISLKFDAEKVEMRLIEFVIDFSDVLLYHLFDDHLRITWNDEFDHFICICMDSDRIRSFIDHIEGHRS